MGSVIDLTGKRFGRLKVLHRGTNTAGGKSRWVCLCDCGLTAEVRAETLKNGSSKSCGCLASDLTIMRNWKHGHWVDKRPTKLWLTWRNIKGRCEKAWDSRYHRYGGRGIKVCDRWKVFENFVQDMGEPPSPDHSIDRIDPNGDYCPENCRWATNKEQQRNRENNRLISFKGKTQCLSAWAEEYGLSQKRLRTRIERDGWDIEKALTTPLKGKGKQNGNCD